MTLTAKIDHLRTELAPFEDPQERLSAVVERARWVKPLPPLERVDSHRVRGCVSPVWIVPEQRDGLCHFRGDAESPVVRGLVLLLCEFFSSATAAEIAPCELDPLDALGLTRNLSPTRRNGLASARALIRHFAAQHAAPAGASDAA